MTFLGNAGWAVSEVSQWWRYRMWKPILQPMLQFSVRSKWDAALRIVQSIPQAAQTTWNKGRQRIIKTATRIASRARKGEFDFRKPNVRRKFWREFRGGTRDLPQILAHALRLITDPLRRRVPDRDRVKGALRAFQRESLDVGHDYGQFLRWIWSRIPGRARRRGSDVDAQGRDNLRRDFDRLAAILRGEIPEISEQGWERLLELGIDRHRLGPYLAHLLRDTPLNPQHRAWLKAEADTGGRVALTQKAETMRCLTALRKAEIDPVLAKGWPLAERLYGGAAMRHSKDIDFHVSETDLPRALQIMSSELGYAPLPGHADRMRLARVGNRAVMEETNAIALMRPDGRHVELHWRLTHMRGWVCMEDILDATEDHPLNGEALDNHAPKETTPKKNVGTVRVLSPRAAMIYLSVHGQMHLWGRMKWLLDIARLMQTRSAEELTADHKMAERIGAGRAVRIAAALAHKVLSAPLPEGWPKPDEKEKWAITHFMSLMTRHGGTPGALEARAQSYLCPMILGEGREQQLAAPRYALWRNLRLWWTARWVK